jgi:hypothetical protein
LTPALKRPPAADALKAFQRAFFDCITARGWR